MNDIVKDQLDKTRKKLMDEISSLSYAQFNNNPDLESWTVAQICHHLFLAEELAIKGLEWGLKEAGIRYENRKDLQAILLDRRKKYKAPKMVEPETGPFEVQQVTDLLSASRKKLLTVLDSIKDPSVLTEKSVKHPLFGSITLEQLIEQVYLHEQRHIEQIKELKQCFKS